MITISSLTPKLIWLKLTPGSDPPQTALIVALMANATKSCLEVGNGEPEARYQWLDDKIPTY